jgi:hypothetical protein
LRKEEKHKNLLSLNSILNDKIVVIVYAGPSECIHI